MAFVRRQDIGSVESWSANASPGFSSGLARRGGLAVPLLRLPARLEELTRVTGA